MSEPEYSSVSVESTNEDDKVLNELYEKHDVKKACKDINKVKAIDGADRFDVEVDGNEMKSDVDVSEMSISE